MTCQIGSEACQPAKKRGWFKSDKIRRRTFVSTASNRLDPRSADTLKSISQEHIFRQFHKVHSNSVELESTECSHVWLLYNAEWHKRSRLYFFGCCFRARVSWFTFSQQEYLGQTLFMFVLENCVKFIAFQLTQRHWLSHSNSSGHTQYRSEGTSGKWRFTVFGISVGAHTWPSAWVGSDDMHRPNQGWRAPHVIQWNV